MVIIIYGRPNCKKCVAAKEHINGMGLQYDYKDIDAVLEDRSDESLDLLSTLSYFNNEYPVIRVDDEYLNYPAGMKRLKELL